VVYANRWIEDLMGLEPEGLLGLAGSRVFPGADARWLKGAVREPRDFKLEAEGREMTLKAEAMPLRDAEGGVMGSVILAEAISESEDGEFQKKIDRLVSLGELSAYVAHEIRNPLTGIRTTVQFVGSKFKPRDPRREDLDDVIKELDRIEQIITGLLMFARPPAARPQPCDLHQVLEKTLAMIELQLGDAQVTVHRDWTENLPLVYADPDLTQQVFLNLCLNAIQAMPEGGALGATGMRRYRTRCSFVDVVHRHRAGDSPGGDGEDLRSLLHHALDGDGARALDLAADRTRSWRRDHGQEQSPGRRHAARLVPAAARRDGGEVVSPNVVVIDDEILIRKSLARAGRPAATGSRRPPRARPGSSWSSASGRRSPSSTCACPTPTGSRCCAGSRPPPPTRR
jgi:hypothetical protein